MKKKPRGHAGLCSPDWAQFEPFFRANPRSERIKVVFLIPYWTKFELFAKGVRFP